MLVTKIDVNLDGTEEILKNHNLETAGEVQQALTNNLMLLADEYAPFSTGVLKNSARPTEDYTGIYYEGPYARYHWYGKIYVDPKTKAACFMTEKGPRSRAGIKKIPTERNMVYKNGALRGPKWVERAFIDHKDEIIVSCEKIANGE